MTLCSVWMPTLSGIIILSLLNSGKITEGHCWHKKFYYKYPHDRSCGLCRICPPEVASDPVKLQQHSLRQCENNTLPDGRIVHCHSTDFQKPSCMKWIPTTGSVNCSMTNDVYSVCRLKCPQGYKVTDSSNVTCDSDLQWSKELPTCVALTLESHHDRLGAGAVICLVLVSVAVIPTMVVIFIRIRRPTQPESDPEYGNQAATKTAGGVVITISNAEIDRKKKRSELKWNVRRGSKVTVCAESQSCAIQYLVFLKTGSKHRPDLGPVYTNKPGESAHIVVDNVQQCHHGYYSWIVGLADGTKEKGKFKMAVREPHIELDSGFFDGSDENSSLSVKERKADVQLQSCGDTTSLITTPTEENPGDRLGCTGFHQLMRNRQDVRSLYVLLDREERPGAISWHVIVTSDLLGYDDDFVTFLEYHLKGQLYKGPMWYILTLMKQQGTTIAEFVEFLRKYQPSSNKVIDILNKYL